MTTRPPIFVLSLAQCTDRRRRIARRLAELGLDFCFFDAVDGHTLDSLNHPLYAGRRRRLFYGKDLTRGEFGCLLTHRAVYQHMVAQGIARALVLEDDAVLQDSLPDVLAALTHTPVSWDIVRLIGSPKYYRQCRAVTPLCGRHELTRLRTTPGGAYAYLLNRHAAQTLLDCTRRNWLPVDAVLGQVWRTRLDVFCVRPSPVLPDHAVASTIGDERFDKSIRLSGWERAVYPLSRAALKIYESAGKAAMNIMNHRREKGKATAVRPYAGHTSDEAVAWVSTEADSTRASP